MGTFSDIFKTIGTYFTGEALMDVVDNVQDRVEQTTRKVIKSAALFVLFVVGLLFVLIGLSQWVETNWHFAHGVGLLLVGGIIVFLAFVIKAFR